MNTYNMRSRKFVRSLIPDCEGDHSQHGPTIETESLCYPWNEFNLEPELEEEEQRQSLAVRVLTLSVFATTI